MPDDASQCTPVAISTDVSTGVDGSRNSRTRSSEVHWTYAHICTCEEKATVCWQEYCQSYVTFIGHFDALFGLMTIKHQVKVLSLLSAQTDLRFKSPYTLSVKLLGSIPGGPLRTVPSTEVYTHCI